MTQLRELDADSAATAARWLADPANSRWLEFGTGSQPPSPMMLRLMAQRDAHCLRLFAAESGGEPIGIVALSNLTQYKTANLWYVLGEKDYAGRGHASRAVRQLLDYGFGPLELQSVSAWAVEENAPSIRVLENNGFRLIGRQRHAHRIDGRPVDRLLFDLLADEHLDPVWTTTHTIS